MMKQVTFGRNMIRSAFLVATLALSGCAAMGPPPMPAPDQIIVPTPIQGSTGPFISPYTSDGVLAKWVDKAVNASAGAMAGQLAGAYAGQQIAGKIPFVGGYLGSMVGEKVGREIALEASGGEAYIKETSDLSFNTAPELAIYLYAKYSTNEHFNDALKSTMEIYPELKMTYGQIIQSAPLRTPESTPAVKAPGDKAEAEKSAVQEVAAK